MVRDPPVVWIRPRSSCLVAAIKIYKADFYWLSVSRYCNQIFHLQHLIHLFNYMVNCNLANRLFAEPKNQPAQKHESKANFTNSDFTAKDAYQRSYGEHKQQRNDRPPRFNRDTDFPRAGHEPPSNCTAGQQWRGQERWSRGAADKPHSDHREARDPQSFPSPFPTSFTRSKESQPQMDSSGAFPQRPRNGGGGGNMAGAPQRRSFKDNTPTTKPPNSNFDDVEGRGNYKQSDRIEERNNSRRMGKPDRPNSDHFERQRDGRPQNFNLRGPGSGTPQEAGFSQDCRITAGDPAHFQNGDIEQRRTGPIKPPNASCHSNREPPPKKSFTPNNPNNNKKRPGQGKGPRGSERGHMAEHSWRPGDQCLALYWEDNKVRHSMTSLPESSSHRDDVIN